LIVGWRRMSNFRRRNSYRRRSSFRRRSSRRKGGRRRRSSLRRRSRGKRSSRRSNTTGYLIFKIRTICYNQHGRELGRLPQSQHRNVRQEGEF